MEATKATAAFFFSVRLAGNGRSGWYGLGKESHKSVHVLHYRGREELLANKPQSAQAQAPPSDLIFEFGSPPRVYARTVLRFRSIEERVTIEFERERRTMYCLDTCQARATLAA